MYSCNPSTNASHTSSTIVEILCFEILNRYIKLWYESPVAKNHKVAASRSLTVIDFCDSCSVWTLWTQ
jgi:hypothetical protein